MEEVKNKYELLDAIRELCSQLHDVLEVESTLLPRARVDNDKEEVSIQEATKNALVNLSCDVFWEYDPLRNWVKFSQPFKKVKEGEDYKGMEFTKFLESVPEVFHRTIQNCFQNLIQQTSEVEEFDYQRNLKDGLREWFHSKCSVVVNSEGKVMKIIGINNNITKSKEEREKIAQEKAKNEMLISFASNLIWEYDCDKDNFVVNNSLHEKLGLEHRKYNYDEASTLFHPETPLNLKGILHKTLISGHTRVQLYSEREQGYLIFNVSYGGLRNSEGHVYRFIGTLDDITEKELLMATAARDPLTNVYNRRMGNLRLKSSFVKYKEQSDFFTIAFFDIDKFKYVNDKFGHDMGDYVLKAVCETIGKEIRNSDMLFRWGGDELLLICSGITKENIYANIDRIRLIIENEKYEYNGEKLNLTVSIGAAYFYKSDHDEQQAVKRADRSLYKAKLAGRNKVCILL